MQDADIGWTATRGPILATGTQDVLSLTTPITGKLNVTGSLTSKATGAVGDAIGGLLGADAAKRIGSVNIKAINASAEIRGNVVITMRPRIAQTWHVEPNFGAQVILGDTSLVLAGAKVNVPTQVKPIIDKTVGEQLNAVSERIRNDKTLERTAREQWAKACRSMPLQGTGATASLPPLWLELKPIRAVAAQPTINATAVIVAVGIEAETPDHADRDQAELSVPRQDLDRAADRGGHRHRRADRPALHRARQDPRAQLAGRTFPEDGSGSVDVTVKKATVSAAGDRLLISLLVHAKEKKSWFGFGADATVHIWGRPVLDQKNQTVRLNDMELAVELEAAFGLLGAAARAAVPHLQRALMEKATIDLKPFAANAQKKIAEAIAEFQKNDSGVRVDANIDNVGLSEVAFDSKTLRVIVDAQGAMNVAVSKLPDL